MQERQNVPTSGDQNSDSACSTPGCCSGLDRRRFLQLAGAAASISAAGGLGAIAGPFEPKDTADHFIPTDKKLKPQWVQALFDRGQREFYAADDLRMIAMPIGGITTGQLYINGEGRLVHWDIFNQHNFSGYGATNYSAGPARSPIKQGFAIQATCGGKTADRTLNKKGFPGVRFCGEYPIASVEYKDKAFPIEISLEAFSPFIPLNAEDSALPATVLQFTLKNTSSELADVKLGGWLENAVCRHSGEVMYGARVNKTARGEGWTMVLESAKAKEAPKETRQPIVLADFEGTDYGKWTAEGKAFGAGPAKGTLPNQQNVGGFQGKGLVNTFLGGDDSHGKLTSPPFIIDRNFLCFLIGGGNQKGKTGINLLVDGKVVRSAAGKNSEKLEHAVWNVKDLAGKEARIEIVDSVSGAWGHVNVDQIELCDSPRPTPKGTLEQQPDFGTMGLAILGDGEPFFGGPTAEAEMPGWLFRKTSGFQSGSYEEKAFEDALPGGLVKSLQLKAGEEAKVTFVVAWHFPNRLEHGNYYAKRFKDASEVVGYVAKDFDRLAGQTRLWHDTWYDSSLPYWLLDRLFSTTSTLATGTCQWWSNGRFWAWEGVGCCHGTCAHVWNYEHSMARLFPELERSVRIMQDYDAGFDPETGAVMFRGEGWKLWAGDSQAGTVLKAYREHQMSPNSDFLKGLWPKIRKSMEFLLDQDGNADGLIEGKQHNTYDIDFYGANTMIGSLYLAALRAAEEMAKELGDAEFAAVCRKVYEAGRKNTLEKLYNGEYFVQTVDLQKHPKYQYADGCLSDHLFGDGWAHQVGLECVYPPETVRSALTAIWKYNWAPDVGPQNEAHPPERWFARPGEAGLFTCTWPKSKHLGPESVRYRDEVWTGIEYQVAGNMAWDGLVTEALAICRGVHDRYHPAKHNPWNEIECGDHYARGMASHGVFLALCGFEYHGPKGHLGFTPRTTPDDFSAAFTAAEGWGTLRQKRAAGRQTNRIELKHGKLAIQTLAVDLPKDAQAKQVSVTVAGRAVQPQHKQDGTRLLLTLPERLTIDKGQAVEIVVTS